MQDQNGDYLIIGLGNVGSEYKKTRHNIGFEVVEALAEKYNGKFQEKSKLKGALAQVVIEGKKVYLLKPTTYMNLSGIALKATVDFFKINLSNILVVVDDADIPFEEFRLKTDSGSGGHKGLESIELHLGCKDYPRLRIGIGDQKVGDLGSHVLGKFSQEEREVLPSIVNKAIEIIHWWLMQGIVIAMNQANIRKKEKRETKDES